MRAVLLAAIASIGLVGCVGDLQPGGDMTGSGGSGGSNGGSGGSGGSSQAREMFDSNVYPIISSKCIGCHNSTAPSGNTTGFVDQNKATAYTTATGFTALVGDWAPADAPIIGRIMKDSPNHHGVTQYSAAEQTTISDWLNQELTERGGSGSGSGSGSGTGTETLAQASARVLADWSSCMTQTNFNTANMAQAWGNMQATNNQQCRDCHVTGAEGFIASDDSSFFFNVVSTNKYYMLQYFSVDLSGGAAAAKIVINTQSFLGVSQGQDPHREHPRFNATNNQGMTALQSFYTKTMAEPGFPKCAGGSKLTN